MELMRLMSAGSVDAIFADPPYRLSGGGVTVKSGRLAPVDKGEWDRSGEVRFDPDVLEPLKFPGLSREKAGGSIKLSVDTVPPSPSEERRIYRIALLRKRSGKTTGVAVFSTPEGDYLEKPLELDLP